MNTDRQKSNIFKHIKTTYDKEMLHVARVLERNFTKQTSYKSHLCFCHESKRLKLLPSFLQMKPPISHPKPTEVTRRAGWSYLRLMISMCHNKLNSTKYVIRETQREILGLIPSTEFATLMEVTLHQNHREKDKTHVRHEQKLKRGNPTVNVNKNKEINKRWVVNVLDCDLEANEVSLLRKGMKFAVTPRSVPVKEILTAVEQGISNLPRDAKDEVRCDICNIIKNAKAPKTCNLSQGERRAMTTTTTTIFINSHLD